MFFDINLAQKDNYQSKNDVDIEVPFHTDWGHIAPQNRIQFSFMAYLEELYTPHHLVGIMAQNTPNNHATY